MNSHKRHGRGDRRGFTMVELMLAVAVITLAVLGTLATEAACSKLNKQGRATNRAMSDLQAAMEQLLLLPLDDIPVAGTGYAPGTAIPAYDGLHLTNQQVVVTYPNFAGVTIPDPLEIVLTCTWQPGASVSTRSLSIATAKAR